MRKNFLTTGAVIALAWISLAPISLLFVATVASSNQPMPVKGGVLLVILFSWIFLSMGMGVFWRKESHQPIVPSPVPSHKTGSKLNLETLQSLKETDFSALCIRIFEKMWPEATFKKPLEQASSDRDWIFHLHQKLYLVHCENRKTFLDSRDIQSFEEDLKKKEAGGGYFFTTGVFSTAAQNTAAPAMIELIDGQKTMELIESFLNEKDLLPHPVHPHEKRRYPRFSCDAFPFEDRPSLELGNVYRRAMKTKLPILNVSHGGICIELPPSEELPTFFQLSLRLPSHSESLHILGEVVWRRLQQGSPMKRYGISFVSVSDENRERLNLFLEKELLVQPDEKKDRRIV